MWKFVAGGMLQVHEFPPFNTSRTGNGSWMMMHNHMGTFTCFDRPECKHGPADTAVGS